ncbi:hypothetical protein B0H17DRAFT_41328 [Mycena rosella]|uniref:Uncharacterized protein n=1 Tax=Mycena rosella TaxID=1033263 RepID=A0AAD7D7G6_MYCRO|nr:hypothetical protein B0H17DRAFT_41328 [Mycena rosella]
MANSLRRARDGCGSTLSGWARRRSSWTAIAEARAHTLTCPSWVTTPSKSTRRNARAQLLHKSLPPAPKASTFAAEWGFITRRTSRTQTRMGIRVGIRACPSRGRGRGRGRRRRARSARCEARMRGLSLCRYGLRGARRRGRLGRIRLFSCETGAAGGAGVGAGLRVGSASAIGTRGRGTRWALGLLFGTRRISVEMCSFSLLFFVEVLMRVARRLNATWWMMR